MKRIMILILVLIMFCACVPTPEEEYVVYRGDNAIEQKLSASAEPTGSNDDKAENVLPFPAHWTEDGQDVNDRFRLDIDAEIVQKADGIYPVYRTRPRNFTDADAQTFAQTLLSDPVSTRAADLTKDDWTLMFREFLDEVEAYREWETAGKPNDGVDRDESGYSQSFIDEESAWYMQQIQKAPDTLPETSVSDYRGLAIGDRKVFRLADGRSASVVALDWTVEIGLDCAAQGFVYNVDRYEHDKRFDDEPCAKAWMPVSMTKEDADRQLAAALEKLGMTDFSVRIARQANLMQEIGGKPHAVATGWAYDLRRDYGSYPLSMVEFMPSQNISYGTDDGFSANKPIGEETLEIMVSSNGVQFFAYTHPRTVVGVESTNVEMLPWDKVSVRIQNAFAITAPIQWMTEQDTVYTARVYRLLLTSYTTRVRDSSDYYEMPCWVVFYDQDIRSRGHESEYDEWYTEEFWNQMRNDTISSHETLIVNAVDGSIVYDDYGNY